MEVVGVDFAPGFVGSRTGVEFHVCFGGGLTVDFHPCLGGAFIPFGISTISPVAFLYFSARAVPGQNPTTRLPTIKQEIKNRFIPDK